MKILGGQKNRLLKSLTGAFPKGRVQACFRSPIGYPLEKKKNVAHLEITNVVHLVQKLNPRNTWIL